MLYKDLYTYALALQTLISMEVNKNDGLFNYCQRVGILDNLKFTLRELLLEVKETVHSPGPVDRKSVDVIRSNLKLKGGVSDVIIQDPNVLESFRRYMEKLLRRVRTKSNKSHASRKLASKNEAPRKLNRPAKAHKKTA